MTTRSAAARARRENVGALADRPRQRRCASDASAPAVARASFKGVKVRSAQDSSELEVAGYATVTECGYEMWDFFGPYTEVVSRDAPAAALASDPDVSFVLNHGGVSLARTKSGTLSLSADDTGLGVSARLDSRMPSVQDVRYALERGDLDEMSFKFIIIRGTWSPDYTEYRIDEFDLDRGDVSVVNYGANPFTSVGLRAASIDLTVLSADDLRELQTDVAQAIAVRGIRPKLSRNAADALIYR